MQSDHEILYGLAWLGDVPYDTELRSGKASADCGGPDTAILNGVSAFCVHEVISRGGG